MTYAGVMENNQLQNLDNNINELLWHSKGWETFYMNNTDINSRIIQVFKENCPEYSNEIRMSTKDISDKLDIDFEYIRLALSIWCRYKCTFYKKNGHINYNNEDNKWVYKLESKK